MFLLTNSINPIFKIRKYMKNRSPLLKTPLIFDKSLRFKKPLIYLILIIMLTCQNTSIFSSVENFVPLDPAGTKNSSSEKRFFLTHNLIFF